MFMKRSHLGRAILDSPNADSRRPVIDGNFESAVQGLYVSGDLAGAPVFKLAKATGSQGDEHVAAKRDATAAASSDDPNRYDLLVIGAGASGLNAALGAKKHGLRVVVLEKSQIASTLEDFPEGKWIYAEPESMPSTGDLWLEGASKEDLLARGRQIVSEHHLEVRTDEGVRGRTRSKTGLFEVRTSRATYLATRVILASGQRGNARELALPGEQPGTVHHRLYSPKHYKDEEILVIGGGNHAVEAALAPAEPKP